MAKTFYLKLGNCNSPQLSPLNSTDSFSVKTDNIIKFNNTTHTLEIQQHVPAVRDRMSKIGTTDSRKLIIHSHGSGSGKLVVKGTNGDSFNVTARRLSEFISNNTDLDQAGNYVTTIYLIACGIGNDHQDYDVGFAQDLANRISGLQDHDVKVYAPYN